MTGGCAGTRFYRAVHTPMTRADAMASCKAQGGLLASLPAGLQPAAVQAAVIANNLKCASSYWIGATDAAKVPPTLTSRPNP